VAERGIKIAISGKGGVGKTTLAAALSLLLAERGGKVLAADADPDGSLAAALGIDAHTRSQIVPIAEQKALIEERTGAKVKQYGQMFRLNPQVDDVAELCGVRAGNNGNIVLLVLGAIEAGGSGCACPESILLRALVTDLVLHKGDALVMDMEAGVEHLGRATARGVDIMLIVVEPSRRSVDSAKRVIELAGQIGLTRIGLVGNKIESAEQERFCREALPAGTFVGMIPYSPSLPAADRQERGVLDGASPALRAAFEAILTNIETGWRVSPNPVEHPENQSQSKEQP
jgi:CO dehydrogenase maturation factor